MISTVLRTPAAAWAFCLRFWNLVRPAWPALFCAAAAPAMLIVFGQGQEALYLIGALEHPSDGLAFASLMVFALSIYITVLVSVSAYYPEISPRTWRSFRPRLAAALIIGGLPIASILGFYMSAAFSHSANKPPPEIFLTPVVTAAALLVVYSLCAVFIVRLIKTFRSPFSEVPFIGEQVRGVLALMGAACLTLAAAIELWPRIGSEVGSVCVFFIGATLWAVASCFLEAWLNERKWPPLMIFAVLAALVGTGIALLGGDNHNAIATVKRRVLSPRPGLEAFTQSWLTAYLQDHPEPTPPPVIIVLAEGGGIRAALHSGMVLSELDRRSCGAFADRVFVISSVSGGSVGVASYMAARSTDASPAPQDCKSARAAHSDAPGEVRKFLTRDHLAPTVAGLMFQDAPLGFSPFPLPEWIYDRANTFAKSLSGTDGVRLMHGFGSTEPRRAIPSGMRLDFESAARRAFPRRQPVLLFNIVRSNDGGLDVISNVTLDPPPVGHAVNMLDRMAGCDGVQRRSVSLATAAVMSARFPFITPPARLDPPRCEGSGRHNDDGRIRYVDGGYLDDSGATTAALAVTALMDACRALPSGRCPKIQVLHIFARDIVSQHGDVPHSNNVAPELSAPLQAWATSKSVLALTPVENFCRLLNPSQGHDKRSEQIPARASKVETCTDLYSARTVFRPSVGLIDNSIVEDGAALGWVNAALDVGSLGEKDYVPLGWLLGHSARHIVDTTTGDRQSAVCRALGGANAAWKC